MTSALSPRYSFLDTLRGFAIAGILLVNAVDALGVGTNLPPHADPTHNVLNVFVQARFIPIFEVLFGVSTWFIIRGARARDRRPQWALLRRLTALFVIGIVFSFVFVGEVLTTYALSGVVVGALVLWTPRWVPLAIGGAGIIALYALGLPSVVGSVPLMLVGAGAGAYGVPAAIERGSRWTWLVAGAAAAATVPALIGQFSAPTAYAPGFVAPAGIIEDPRFNTPGQLAGLLMATLYTSVLALLWCTPIQRLLRAVFDPLGRMALTNYVLGTTAVILIGLALPQQDAHDSLVTIIIALVVLAAGTLLSRLWLRVFQYGPIELAWRLATWMQAPVLRRGVGCSDVADELEPRIESRAK